MSDEPKITDSEWMRLQRLEADRRTWLWARLKSLAGWIVGVFTAPAMLTGLPASVLAGTSQQGRAGGRVDASNVGVSIGVLQGLGGVTSLSFVNPTAAATSILNSALSGKEMYLSGSFAI